MCTVIAWHRERHSSRSLGLVGLSICHLHTSLSLKDRWQRPGFIGPWAGINRCIHRLEEWCWCWLCWWWVHSPFRASFWCDYPLWRLADKRPRCQADACHLLPTSCVYLYQALSAQYRPLINRAAVLSLCLSPKSSCWLPSAELQLLHVCLIWPGEWLMWLIDVSSVCLL